MTNPRLEELRAKFQESPRRYFAPFANELRKAGDAAQAIAICRTHLAGQPGHVSGHIVLAQALYEASQTDEAREVFLAALELDPENLIALRTMGEIAQVQGEFADARRWYERLLDADPRNAEIGQLLQDLPPEPVKPEIVIPAALLEAGEPLPRPPAVPEPAAEPVPPPPAGLDLISFPGQVQAMPAPPAPEMEPAGTAEAPPPTGHVGGTADLAPALPQNAPVPPVSASDTFSDALHAREEMPAAPEPGPVSGAGAPVEATRSAEPSTTPPGLDATWSQFPEATLEWPPVSGSTHPTLDEPPAEPPGMALPSGGMEPPEGADAASDASLPDDAAGDHESRAMFAENGFEGSADVDRGPDWARGTPAAAYSDFEAAPEDWFIEPEPIESGAGSDAVPGLDATDAILSQGGADATGEDRGPVPDSWFDALGREPEVASSESTAGEDFWFAPDLHPLGHAGDEGALDALAAASGGADPDAVGDAAAAELPPRSSGDGDTFAEPSRTIEDDLAVSSDDAASGDLHFSAFGSGVIEDRQEPAAPFDFSEVTGAGSPDKPDALRPSEEVIDSGTPAFQGTLLPEPASAGDVPASTLRAEMIPQFPMTEADADGIEAAAAPDERAPEPVVREASDAVRGHAPSFGASIESPAPAPFVTETLAELYLQQGFRAEALAIYRQLSERDPDDASLRRRIAVLEQGQVSDVIESATAPVAEAPGRSSSVRSYFSRLASRTPSAAAREARLSRSAAEAVEQASPSSSPTPAAGSPDSPFASAASALATLFSASNPPATDEGAASSLAGAFTEPAGRPSRAAERELSLDHLFRDVPSGGKDGVMLDEFYAPPPASSGEPAPPDESETSPDEGAADIRQFTAWLEGLRKK